MKEKKKINLLFEDYSVFSSTTIDDENHPITQKDKLLSSTERITLHIFRLQPLPSDF